MIPPINLVISTQNFIFIFLLRFLVVSRKPQMSSNIVSYLSSSIPIDYLNNVSQWGSHGSSSKSYDVNRGESRPPKCWCGNIIVVRRTTTIVNFGKRFYINRVKFVQIFRVKYFLFSIKFHFFYRQITNVRN